MWCKPPRNYYSPHGALLLNLHVLHCTIIPLWDNIMMKILFGYFLIISQAQLADKLRLPVLQRNGKYLFMPFSFFYHWTITIFMREPAGGKKTVLFSTTSFHLLYGSFFFFFNETSPRKSLKHLSV